MSNRKAFLDMLAFSEGTCADKHPLTKHDGYDVIVTGSDGPEIFEDFSEHPFVGRKPKHISGKLYSTASGRYQFMRVHWEHYRDALSLHDFGPDSQDKWAIQLIRERSALPLIDAGDFDAAVYKVRNIWASLPGAGYNQPEHDIEKLRKAYIRAGGQLA
jgi:muramidase (phage lysozyme)